MPSYQARGALAVVAATLLAACVIFGQTGERVVLLTSGMEEFSSGSKDVLSGRDFVPLGGGGSSHHLSRAAQKELCVPANWNLTTTQSGLYAAAGIKMSPLHPARMQGLAEVAKALPKEHTDIDQGSKKRLKAAAANRLDEFEHNMPTSKAESRRRMLRKEIGQSVAAYFTKQDKL